MKVFGKRQRKNRSRARVRFLARTRAAVNQFEVEHIGITAAAIVEVVFHASDGGPCDCWGDSVQWVALPFTRAQLLHQGAAPLNESPNCQPDE